MARDAGLFGAAQGTNAFDRAIDKFAAAVRASITAPAQSREPIYQTGWPTPETVWGDVDKVTYETYSAFGYTRRRIVYTAPLDKDASKPAGITKEWCMKMAALEPDDGAISAGAPSVEHDERGACMCSGLGPCEHPGDASCRIARAASTSANVAQGAEHPDDVAVDRFAAAMKEKLAAARAKGRSGWQQCSPFVLSEMLRAHVDKGDPRDVANFCMMLWNLDWSIGAPSAQTALADDALFDDDYERDEFLQACRDFEGAGETAVDYWLLMKWADAGLLECEHFTVTAAGNAEIARTDAATATADRPIQSPDDA
ncbi:hypothetical protein [Paraburkholderia fungorum]|jgi:hypothetical protein|uniref:hypothetical protein n=1 Tax=Paraburkholderia fungorum TaxID=134537 RepID=UPI001FC90721|nr:hypothetical protein [Paraburkholderia fungorum]